MLALKSAGLRLTVMVCLLLVTMLCSARGSYAEGGEMPTNPIAFWELASNDADASVKFFRDVFGWKIEFNEGLGFYQAPIDPSENSFSGGYIFTLKKAKLPFLTLYIAVEDIDAMAKRVEEHGGHIVEGPLMIGRSKLCLFNEPSGVGFAMIEIRKPEEKTDD
jgi:predicted enzyme related to lactoylglutathione lyase